MIGKHLITICSLALLLSPAVAISQNVANPPAADPSDVQNASATNAESGSQVKPAPAAPAGRLIVPRSFLGPLAKVLANVNRRPVSLFKLAQSPVPSLRAIDTAAGAAAQESGLSPDTTASNSDTSAEPKPKPTLDDEIDALKKRVEQLEAQKSGQEAAPASPPAVDLETPFAYTDFGIWLNGQSRQRDSPLDSKYFSGEFRADTFYGTDFNQPIDHSMGGSSEVFRSGEVQLEDLSFGGDFHAGQMRGRVLFLMGMFAATTVRNDASPAVGQWDVRAAYKYVSEAYGGYHFNVQHGLNVDAGIFVSYVGLFSYHNFDNWAYQPSYVSSNTPWFFNGVRIQWFPKNNLKIEPWFINGWQSYNKFNSRPGIGGQIRYAPKPWMNIILNQYSLGQDNVGLPHRSRWHEDDSIEIKYYDHPKAGNGIDRMAFTVTADAGCETGDGVTCYGGRGPYNPLPGMVARSSPLSVTWATTAGGFTRMCSPLRSAADRLTTKAAI